MKRQTQTSKERKPTSSGTQQHFKDNICEECVIMTVCKFTLFLFVLLVPAIGVLMVQPDDDVSDDFLLPAGTEDFYLNEETYEFLIRHSSHIDTALVYVSNGLEDTIYVWVQTAECYKCKLIYLGPVKKMNVVKVEIDTTWPIRLVTNMDQENSDNQTICRMQKHFKQFGNYSWFINKRNTGGDPDCPLVSNNSPPDAFIPLYVAIGVYAGLAVLYIFINQIFCTGTFYRFLTSLGMVRVVTNELGTPTNPVSEAESNSIQRPSKDKPKRLRSLDAFRGLSLVVMIFANYGSGQYHVIGHSPWNGLTVADLVFPWFVWIMGVSITMSFHALIRHGVSRKAILLKVVRRSAILFGLGLLLSGGNVLSAYRVPGVLQRIGFSYFVVATIHLISAKPPEESYRITNPVYRELRDILDYWYEWIIMLSLLALHICLTFVLPVPGCPTGYLGPGGPLVGEDTSLENCTGGAANYIDKVILTYSHIYPHGTQTKVYQTTVPHDPEGILGTLTSIFMTFLGLQAGKIFHLFSYPRDRILRFLAWSLLLGVIAGGLCGFSKEDGIIPVNKNLWSVSFIFTTACMGFFLLAFFYYFIDVKCWWTGVPFFFVGMNSIAVYCGSELLSGHFPFSWQPIHVSHAESLASNLLGASLWVVISYYMYTINFFVKI